MTKKELTALAKSLRLPKGWKVTGLYSKHSGRKVVNETDYVIVGQPIAEHQAMHFRGHAWDKLVNPILKQLNAGRKRKEKKWVEFGGGYCFGGEFYEIHFGVDYDADEEETA